MLKAIELSGFKSFADRTKLEFDEGICAIVGPNGSGKSNVVDAIKWVLGEQSMKKLRSTESTDVIFSGSAGRSPLGTAEVTLTFDNANQTFSLGTPEVHITRRIYRSGEGEYLINRQATRLKDIKDLLAGTGLGTQAYSIIEQGRVESLLQSSSVQRRVIFDEAAGISRFNARKVEIQRRHERVEQNLVRLSDKVRDLENQLKSVRSQAGKTELYKQYSERLKELRIQSALIEYRQHFVHIIALEQDVAGLTLNTDKLSQDSRNAETNIEQKNKEIDALDQEIRQYEGDLAAVRQKITGEQSTIELQFAQIAELEADILQSGRQLLELKSRSSGLGEQQQKTEDEIRKAENDKNKIDEAYQKLLGEDKAFEELCRTKQNECGGIDRDIAEKNKQKTELAGTISGLDTQLQALKKTNAKNNADLAKQEEKNAAWETQLDKMENDLAKLNDDVQQKKTQLEEAKERKSTRIKEFRQLSEQLSELKQKQSGQKARKSLLEDLIRKNEGLSPGVQEVLQQAKDANSPFRHAFGLVADLLRVEFESASLIELALGSVSQHIVVSPKPELFRHIEENAANFAGRVGFHWLDPREPEAVWMKTFLFADRKGVLGRADQFVQTEPRFQHLARRLLGRIWIVQNLAVARQLYKESDDRTSFLTISGEMLTPDGALIVGPLNTASGLITRRSELRNLSDQLAQTDKDIAELQIQVNESQELVNSNEIDVEEERREHQQALSAYQTLRHQCSAIEEKYNQGVDAYNVLLAEIEKTAILINDTAGQCTQTKTRQTQLNENLAALESRQLEAKDELEQTEQNYEEHKKETTNAKIKLATSKQRLRSLGEQFNQYENSLKERQKMLTQQHQHNSELKERREAILLAVLQIETKLSNLFLRKEQLAAHSAEYYAERNGIAQQRKHLQNEYKRLQKEEQKEKDKKHAKESERDKLVLEQKTVSDRIREEYEIDITAIAPTDINNNINNVNNTTASPVGAQLNSQSILQSNTQTNTQINTQTAAMYQQEISDLRMKIQRLGNVNLEAVETLDSLEAEYKKYSAYYNDIVSAKKKIEQELERNNGTTRELFAETFENVRQHFQTVFQQLFGGGSADLVLDNPEKMLESGVEIVAKPPGKELKNVMLLSGGEKTLTCFALLLAFFRHRPNPVCILDECDAALDEGNVDRYNNVIKVFSKDTQFLMITHSKKSMAHAKTIYGITMQESGVSKPVSVQFREVGENGEILTESLKKAA
ncbi:chromosome partition protein Smc [Planctomycetales bacterium]|nr:chromosome partition protein Smc [Planctomycetales bacterium]